MTRLFQSIPIAEWLQFPKLRYTQPAVEDDRRLIHLSSVEPLLPNLGIIHPLGIRFWPGWTEDTPGLEPTCELVNIAHGSWPGNVIHPMKLCASDFYGAAAPISLPTVDVSIGNIQLVVRSHGFPIEAEIAYYRVGPR